MIARRLRRDPGLHQQARANLRRWIRNEEGEVAPVLLGWAEIIEILTRQQLADFLELGTAKAWRLPQSSPFTGLLTSASSGSSTGSMTKKQLEFLLREAREFARESEPAVLPNGWERRTKALKFGKVAGWCLAIQDLIISKLAAARIKDLEFAIAMIELGHATSVSLLKRIKRLEFPEHREAVRRRLAAVLHEIKSANPPWRIRAKRKLRAAHAR